MGYYVKEDLEAMVVSIVYSPDEGEGVESKEKAWLKYAKAIELQGLLGLLGCFAVWILEQTPEHLDWLPAVDLNKY
jgi:hypothetical protein